MDINKIQNLRRHQPIESDQWFSQQTKPPFRWRIFQLGMFDYKN